VKKRSITREGGKIKGTRLSDISNAEGEKGEREKGDRSGADPGSYLRLEERKRENENLRKKKRRKLHFPLLHH